MKRYASPSLIWALSLIVVWLAVAAAMGRPVWATEPSQVLVAFGAIKGAHFDASEAWRLVASQWLHVKAPHMLLNALIIGAVGLAAEQRFGRVTPASTALAGGTLGQLLVVLTAPGAFISGASQACLALCGFALAARALAPWGRTIAILGVLVAVLLDVFVSGHGGVKTGHIVGLAFGLGVGLILRLRDGASRR